MDTYEKKYKDALQRAKHALDCHNQGMVSTDVSLITSMFPELQESEDERVRREIMDFIDTQTIYSDERRNRWFSYLEKQGETFTKRDVDNAYIEGMVCAKNELDKQGEQNPTIEIEPFEAEHGKYYYCIKDYFCGGRKQASKGDVIEALRGLPIMGLKDASEYFLPVNSIKCYSAWKPSDEQLEALKNAIHIKPFENPSDNPLWGLYEQLKKLREDKV